MVHPLLTNDPTRMQGQIGLISEIDYEKGEAQVRFPYEVVGIYPISALLSLLPKEMILASIQEKLTELEPKEIRILLDIYRLQQDGRPGAIEEALRWAIAYQNVGKHSTISLEDFIERGLSENIDRQQSRGR
ncbi:hypothetical protein [Pedobacter sp. ASV28]|uniref:hypothetical protein n=1 Tax=Pedobacter sp. ASV28 TaxID=2795123 RepID=UPI0018EBC5E7|nr:hypothetical protein [Pedobacter sp. ASV28]